MDFRKTYVVLKYYMLKLFKPFMSEDAKKLCMKVLDSDQLAEGAMVKQFEKEFGDKFELNHVVALNSGTSALELAYELADIQPGDEVITPILTCTATNLPLVRRGAKIIFADIGPDLNVSVEDIINRVTPQTKAIVFVHFGGNSRGLDELVEFCNENSITLIEDAAQSIGGYFGKADFTCISLQAIKTLTSGDGGVLLTRRLADYETAKRLRWFGYDREKKQLLGDTDLFEAGYKYHMNNITAAIGLGNLRNIDPIIAHRRLIANIYRSYGLFAYPWLAGGFTDDYEGLKERLGKEGIEIGQYHYRNDKYTVFNLGYGLVQDCPAMDLAESSYFFVPYHHGITEEDAHKIGKLIKSYEN